MALQLVLCQMLLLDLAYLPLQLLQQFPMMENRTGPQTIEFLTKRVVALGAVQQGQFLVDCETFTSVANLGHPLRWRACGVASVWRVVRHTSLNMLEPSGGCMAPQHSPHHFRASPVGAISLIYMCSPHARCLTDTTPPPHHTLALSVGPALKWF
uniref:Mediator of RNA polymerase II transcription subunit 20 n=1 Tax=Timema poppense TaxID=170557 RepID=A0A7R9H0L9_TIMPO|nr:unnamed protein product [Timema poppensis]